jgi:hypothetical protein
MLDNTLILRNGPSDPETDLRTLQGARARPASSVSSELTQQVRTFVTQEKA